MRSILSLCLYVTSNDRSKIVKMFSGMNIQVRIGSSSNATTADFDEECVACLVYNQQVNNIRKDVCDRNKMTPLLVASPFPPSKFKKAE